MSNTLEYVKKNIPSAVQKIGIALLIFGVALGAISYFVDIAFYTILYVHICLYQA